MKGSWEKIAHILLAGCKIVLLQEVIVKAGKTSHLLHVSMCEDNSQKHKHSQSVLVYTNIYSSTSLFSQFR